MGGGGEGGKDGGQHRINNLCQASIFTIKIFLVPLKLG